MDPGGLRSKLNKLKKLFNLFSIMIEGFLPRATAEEALDTEKKYGITH
jgi:hypothetical protein